MVLILPLLLCFSPGSSAQVSSQQIDAVFSPLRSDRAPGAAVLVVHNGRAVYRRGFGLADQRTRHAITPETNFRLASCTKQFTAMAVMLLVHDGKLRYETSLTDVFPEFPAYGKSITIRHLLNHSSGLKDYEDLLAAEYPNTPDEKIPQILAPGVLKLLEQQTSTYFAPGSHWKYNNSGYVLLGLAVEKVSGESFGQFLRQRIFLPLGMAQTVLYEQGGKDIAERAYGHSCNRGICRVTDQSSTSATPGDGGIYSSLVDLEKWNAALRQFRLLRAEEMREAWTPASVPAVPSEAMQTGQTEFRYGFGWFLDPYRDHKRMWHYGETRGFRSAIQRFPDDDLTVIVLANRTDIDPGQFALKVADLYLNGSPSHH